MNKLFEDILKADIRSVAKLMRLIEKEDPLADETLKDLYPHTGKAYVIGLTGLPGSGKSTLIDAVIKRFRIMGGSVGVIAIDPSSPFTGGSILGDRIRMQKHSSDDEIFIKSLPTRGWKGGVSKVTSKMITVMDAMGKDIVLVETAGVGQTEVEVKDLVHTTVVVLVGGLGDSIQIIKAGIIEIADIFAINKSKDDEKALDLEADLNNLFELSSGAGDEKKWKPLVFKTEALQENGIDELVEGIELHRDHLEKTGDFARYFRVKSRSDLMQALADDFNMVIKEKLEKESSYKKLLQDLEDKKSDPFSMAKILIKKLLKDP